MYSIRCNRSRPITCRLVASDPESALKGVFSARLLEPIIVSELRSIGGSYVPLVVLSLDALLCEDIINVYFQSKS